jgi:hypothetical protein
MVKKGVVACKRILGICLTRACLVIAAGVVQKSVVERNAARPLRLSFHSLDPKDAPDGLGRSSHLPCEVGENLKHRIFVVVNEKTDCIGVHELVFDRQDTRTLPKCTKFGLCGCLHSEANTHFLVFISG